MSRSSLFAFLLALSSLFVVLPSQAQTYACVETNMGEFCMKFLRENAPNTVTNFLKYVSDKDFDQTFFHRTVADFVIQGGGYKLDPLGEPIPEDAAITNEFSAKNLRGTVAMAKFDNQPNSATSEWFVNLIDNPSLDTNNGGFTVFAHVVRGMDVVDAIGRSQRVDLTASLGGVFGEVPVIRKDADGVGIEDLVQIISVRTTDTVEEEPIDGGNAEEEAALYQCVAEWITKIQPREVCMDSNMGGFCMDLMPDVASKAVANFVHYVADGDYNGTFIHGSVPGFVVQGGGYQTSPVFAPVPSDDAVANEYSAANANTRGAVSLAKMSNSPDSATSVWVVNLADNTERLGPNNNGGFTVFARVREADMAVFDQIAALDVWNLSTQFGDAFGETPLRRAGVPEGINLNDFVVINRAYIPGHETNPCLTVKPTTTTEYANRAFILPVRMGDGQILEFRFTQGFTQGDDLFLANMQTIRALADVGQDVAVYSAAEKMLRIPSVLTPDGRVIYNVRLYQVDDPGTIDMEFKLQDFDLEPPATTTP